MSGVTNVYGHLPLFDPEAGTTVVAPAGEGRGYWAGGCSAIHDPETAQFYLCYRERDPERRGHACRIAHSVDGTTFDTICSIEATDLGTPSIEKSAITRSPDGTWRLYVSYVDGATWRWRVDVFDAETPDGFSASRRQAALTHILCGNEGVKDPVVIWCGGLCYMYVNYAPPPADGSPESVNRMHAGGNAFVSGVVNTGSGLATSRDGVCFEWQGSVLEPGAGWDNFMVRMTSVVHTPPTFTAFFDGRPNVAASYEDKCGLATTLDLRHFTKLSVDAPALQSPHGTGCLRYPDVVCVDGRVHYFYEYAREDGSHELRTNVVEP